MTAALSQSADLVQAEFRLARAELSEKLAALRAGLVMMAVGAILLIVSLGMLLQALVSVLIAAGVSPPVAILLVAGGTAVIGLVLFLMGQKRLEPSHACTRSHDRFAVGRQPHGQGDIVMTSSAHLQREADAARVGLADTLGQLRHGMAPSALSGEALALAKDTGLSLVKSLAEQARANPVPALLIGAGLAMLLTRTTGGDVAPRQDRP